MLNATGSRLICVPASDLSAIISGGPAAVAGLARGAALAEHEAGVTGNATLFRQSKVEELAKLAFGILSTEERAVVEVLRALGEQGMRPFVHLLPEALMHIPEKQFHATLLKLSDSGLAERVGYHPRVHWRLTHVAHELARNLAPIEE